MPHARPREVDRRRARAPQGERAGRGAGVVALEQAAVCAQRKGRPLRAQRRRRARSVRVCPLQDKPGSLIVLADVSNRLKVTPNQINAKPTTDDSAPHLDRAGSLGLGVKSLLLLHLQH